MGTNVKLTIQKACRSLLQPIASVALKCGMTWKEFSDLSKSVFVEVATKEYGIQGRPTNISRVSILTGISRKEVKRQRDLLHTPELAVLRKTTDATRLLSGWHQDSEFLDPEGQPLPLPRYGPSPSFQCLFDRYGGDTSEQTLVKEIRKTNAVEIDESDRMVVKSRYYMPKQISDEWIGMAGEFLHDLGVNISYNMEADNKERSRFLGFAVDHHIDSGAMAEFREYMEVRGQEFLQGVDDWLSEHSVVNGTESNASPIRLGVGLFTIQDNAK